MVIIAPARSYNDHTTYHKETEIVVRIGLQHSLLLFMMPGGIDGQILPRHCYDLVQLLHTPCVPTYSLHSWPIATAP